MLWVTIATDMSPSARGTCAKPNAGLRRMSRSISRNRLPIDCSHRAGRCRRLMACPTPTAGPRCAAPRAAGSLREPCTTRRARHTHTSGHLACTHPGQCVIAVRHHCPVHSSYLIENSCSDVTSCAIDVMLCHGRNEKGGHSGTPLRARAEPCSLRVCLAKHDMSLARRADRHSVPDSAWPNGLLRVRHVARTMSTPELGAWVCA